MVFEEGGGSGGCLVWMAVNKKAPEAGAFLLILNS